MLLIALSMLFSTAEAVPVQVSHQGRLIEAGGAAVEGSVALTFSLYSGESGGSALWDEDVTVEADNGFYAVALGAVDDLDSSLFDGSVLWLEVAKDGVALPERIAVRMPPFAQASAVSASVDGGTVDATSIAINGTEVIGTNGLLDWSRLGGIPSDLADGDADTLAGLSCSPGQVAKAITGGWACADDATGGGTGGLTTPQGGLSWIWADQASADSYTPSTTYRYSTGTTPTITRSAVGRYRVSHPGVSTGTGGHHQVSAYGPNTSTTCKIASWSATTVDIECYDIATGAAADSRYTLLTLY